MPNSKPFVKLTPCGMFASRDSLEEANAYAEQLISALPLEHRAAAYTLHWVTINTALQLLEKSQPAETPANSLPPVPDYFYHVPNGSAISALTQDQCLRMLPNLLIRLSAMSYLLQSQDEHPLVALASILGPIAQKGLGLEVHAYIKAVNNYIESRLS